MDVCDKFGNIKFDPLIYNTHMAHPHLETKKRLKQKLEYYLKKLKEEKELFDVCRDRSAHRMAVPPLFLRLEDYVGAMDYFLWYDSNFPEDAGFPEFYLAWAMTLFKNNQAQKAEAAVILSYIQNPYLIGLIVQKENPLVCGGLFQIESREWAINAVHFCYLFMTPDFVTWLGGYTLSEAYSSFTGRIDSINKLLDGERDQPLRTNLTDAMSGIWYAHKAIIRQEATSNQ